MKWASLLLIMFATGCACSNCLQDDFAREIKREGNLARDIKKNILEVFRYDKDMANSLGRDIRKEIKRDAVLARDSMKMINSELRPDFSEGRDAMVKLKNMVKSDFSVFSTSYKGGLRDSIASELALGNELASNLNREIRREGPHFRSPLKGLKDFWGREKLQIFELRKDLAREARREKRPFNLLKEVGPIFCPDL